jgi:hypothetical protein
MLNGSRGSLPCAQREIVTKLDGEKPRNSLDMRGRLDSKGERYGEVIKFKYGGREPKP